MDAFDNVIIVKSEHSELIIIIIETVIALINLKILNWIDAILIFYESVQLFFALTENLWMKESLRVDFVENLKVFVENGKVFIVFYLILYRLKNIL